MSFLRYAVPSYSSAGLRRTSQVVAGSEIAATTTITPDAVTAAWGVVAPTLVLGGLVLTPTPATAAWSVVAPVVVAGGITLTPDPATAAFSVETPTVVSGSTTVLPDPAVATFEVNTPVVTNTGGPVVIPDLYTVGTTGGVRRAVQVHSSASRVTVSSVTGALVPTPSSTLTPDAVVATFTVPAPSISQPADALPEIITAGTSGRVRRAIQLYVTPTMWGAPSIRSGFDLFLSASPDPVTAAWSVATPSITGAGVTVTPSPATAAFAVNTPTLVLGGVTLTPSAAGATFAVNTPTLSGALTVSPTAATAAFSIVAPAISTGAVTMLPSATIATFSVFSPSIEGGDPIVSFTGQVITFTSPGHFVQIT